MQVNTKLFNIFEICSRFLDITHGNCVANLQQTLKLPVHTCKGLIS